MREKFWEAPLESLSTQEWEALCDGCGLCCLNKLEDEDTGDILYTRVACNLLDTCQGGCREYPIRHQYVPECISLQLVDIPQLAWLPESCAYRLRYEEKALPSWHYLLSGDRNLARMSSGMANLALIHENEMDEDCDLEDYAVETPIAVL